MRVVLCTTGSMPLIAIGVRRFTNLIERETALQEALGRWNDLCLFSRRLAGRRDEAEERGSVTLAAEIEHLLAALEPTIAAIRRSAIEISKTAPPTIVPLRRSVSR